MKRRTAYLILFAILVGVLGFIAFGWFPQGFLRGYVERRLQEALGPGSRLTRSARSTRARVSDPHTEAAR